MNRPAFHLSLPAFVISAALLAGPAVAAQESKTNYAVVAHSVVKLLEEEHYSLGEFGDELSRKSLQHFIDTLRDRLVHHNLYARHARERLADVVFYLDLSAI